MKFIIILIVIFTLLFLLLNIKKKVKPRSKFKNIIENICTPKSIGIKNMDPIRNFNISSDNSTGSLIASGTGNRSIERTSIINYNYSKEGQKLCYYDIGTTDIRVKIDNGEKTSANCWTSDDAPYCSEQTKGKTITDDMACANSKTDFSSGSGWKVLKYTTKGPSNEFCGGGGGYNDHLWSATCAQKLQKIELPAWTSAVLYSNQVKNTINNDQYYYALVVCNPTNIKSSDLITVDIYRSSDGNTYDTFNKNDIDYMCWNDSIERNNIIPYQQKRSFDIENMLKGNTNISVTNYDQQSFQYLEVNFGNTNVSTTSPYNITLAQNPPQYKNVFLNSPENPNSSYFNFAIKWNNDIEFHKIVNANNDIWGNIISNDAYAPYIETTWNNALSKLEIIPMISIYEFLTFLRKDVVIPNNPSYYFDLNLYKIDSKITPVFFTYLENRNEYAFKKIYDSPLVQKYYFDYINNSPELLAYLNSSIVFNTNIDTENIIEGNINYYYPPKPATETINYSVIRDTAKSLNIFIKQLGDFYYDMNPQNIRPFFTIHSFPATKEDFIKLYSYQSFRIDNKENTEKDITDYASNIYNSFGDSSLVQQFNLNFYPKNAVNDFINQTHFSNGLIYQKILNATNFFQIENIRLLEIIFYPMSNLNYLLLPLLNFFNVNDISYQDGYLYFNVNCDIIRTNDFGKTIEKYDGNMPESQYTEPSFITEFLNILYSTGYITYKMYNILQINSNTWIVLTQNNNDEVSGGVSGVNSIIYKLVQTDLNNISKINFYESGKIDFFNSTGLISSSNDLTNINNPTYLEIDFKSDKGKNKDMIYLSPNKQDYILKYFYSDEQTIAPRLILYQNIFYSEGFLEYIKKSSSNFSDYNQSYFNYCNSITDNYNLDEKKNLKDNRCFCVLKDKSLKSKPNYDEILRGYFMRMLNTSNPDVINILTDPSSNIFCIDGNCFYNNPIMQYQNTNGSDRCTDDLVICNSIIENINSKDINQDIKIKCSINCNCDDDEICNKGICYKKCFSTDNSACKISNGNYYACVTLEGGNNKICKNCQSNIDCPTGYICENNICKGPICQSNSNCSENKKCINSLCRDCVDNSDCANKDNKKCNNGYCVQCINNSDCDRGFRCSNNTCVQCTQDSHCFLDEHCENNRCVKYAQIITSDKEDKTPEIIKIYGKNISASQIFIGICIFLVCILVIIIIKKIITVIKK